MSIGGDMLRMGQRYLGEPVTGYQTFIYRGKHWACMAAALDRGMDLGIGPPVNQTNRTLIIRKDAIKPIRTADANEGWTADGDDLTADYDAMPPHPGKKIIFEARTYEVEGVKEDGQGAWWIVRLKSPD